jgi:hypothetical protein
MGPLQSGGPPENHAHHGKVVQPPCTESEIRDEIIRVQQIQNGNQPGEVLFEHDVVLPSGMEKKGCHIPDGG